MLSVLLFVVSAGGANQVNEHVDMVEINHYHNEWGQEIFSQVIWWEWSKWENDFVVVDWRLLTDAYEADDGHRAATMKEIDRMSELVPLRERSSWRGRAERMYKGRFVGGRLMPRRLGGKYVVRFMDGGFYRVVVASTFRETWSQKDPERENRKLLPEESRRKLSKGP